MRKVEGYPLWLGHFGDACELRSVLDAGIRAVVDLAAMEPPVLVTRDLVYCRFPIVDGDGNPGALLRVVIETTAGLVRSGQPTLVFCSAGLSRTPCVAAAALSLVSGESPEQWLDRLLCSRPGDVSPGLWKDVLAVIAPR